MSKRFKDKINRLKDKELLNLKRRFDNILKDIIIKSYLPNFMIDKKDSWDIDYFILLKKWYSIKDIKERIQKFFEIEIEEKIDLEYTFLIKDIKQTKKQQKDIKYHLDLFLIDEEVLISFKKHNINDIILEATNNSKDLLEFILDNIIYEYYRVPFLSYYIWIILRKFWIKYSSKWVFYYVSYKETWRNDKYILITYNLSKFLEIFFKDFHLFNNNIKNNLAYKYYEEWKINTEKKLVEFIETIKIFTYQLFEIDNLKYEEKRKIKSYKRNETINKRILEDKINNLYLFLINNNLLEKKELKHFKQNWFNIWYLKKFWLSNKIRYEKINNYFKE